MSAGIKLHRKVRAELDELTARGILTVEQGRRIKERYPVEPRSLGLMVKLFVGVGAMAAAIGGAIVMRAHLAAFWRAVWPYIKALIERINWDFATEGALLLAFVSLLLQGSRLKAKSPDPRLGGLFELGGAFALHGLVTAVAKHYATNSGNWPATLGIAAALLLPMAYALGNRMILWYALGLFFFFFGAETGYISGWGVYYLGMNYPVRYLGIGLLTLGAAWGHGVLVRGRLANFARVYLHYSLILINLSLWALALFGYFDASERRWEDSSTERMAFTGLWALVSLACLFSGASGGLKLLRGYGLTFLILNIYTFYFQFIAYNSGDSWFIHLLVTGGSMLWLGSHIERVKSLAMQGDKEEDKDD